MSQTLLAVLALVLLSFLSLAALGDRNDTISGQAKTLVREEARGLAVGVLDQLSAVPFERDAAGWTPAAPTRVDSVVTWAPDLDALPAAQGLRAEVLLRHPVSGLENPLVFDASFQVEPVAADGGDWAPAADTSDYKRVTFHILHPQTGQRVALQRVYADLDHL